MKLGYIGLGVMGSRMAIRLVEAGHEVTVWNRNRAKAGPLVAKGARLAASPAALAREADIVMMCVMDQAAEEAVLFGKDGIATGIGSGKVVVDFSSIPPDSARSFAK